MITYNSFLQMLYTAMKPHSESYNKANKQLNLSIFLYKKIIKHFYTLI